MPEHRSSTRLSSTVAEARITARTPAEAAHSIPDPGHLPQPSAPTAGRVAEQKRSRREDRSHRQETHTTRRGRDSEHATRRKRGRNEQASEASE